MGSVGAHSPDPGTARQIHDFHWAYVYARQQSIGKLFSVVGEQSDELDRTGFVQGIQKAAGAHRTLVRFDLHKHPARCQINRHKQVASRGLLSHLRQILESVCTKPAISPLKDL